jgi:hypothetical protein
MAVAYLGRRRTLDQQIAAIYASGRLGPWFDPSDLTTMYTTSAGSTLVGTPGNGTAHFVGRMEDKSGGGYHALAANDSTARPQLSARVNLLDATDTLSTQSVTTVATNYTLSFSGAGSITLSGTGSGTYNAGSHTVTCTAGTLTATVSGTVTNADIRPTNIHAAGSIPAYQQVIDPETYDSVGFPYRLIPNGTGTGQALQTSTITPGTDSVTVGVGIRKLSDAAYGKVMEFGPTITANGTLYIAAPVTAADNIGLAVKGTIVPVAMVVSGVTAPITLTILAKSVISTPIRSVVLNNGSETTSAASLGAGNFATDVLNLFSRNGASLWFGGQYFGQIMMYGPQLTASELATVEAWINSKTKAY